VFATHAEMGAQPAVISGQLRQAPGPPDPHPRLEGWRYSLPLPLLAALGQPGWPG
jgi:hypothetical protein